MLVITNSRIWFSLTIFLTTGDGGLREGSVVSLQLILSLPTTTRTLLALSVFYSSLLSFATLPPLPISICIIYCFIILVFLILFPYHTVYRPRYHQRCIYINKTQWVYVCMSVCVSFCVSICVSFCMSVCVYVCLSVSNMLSQKLHYGF